MNNLFHPDSKFMQLGYKLFDLISLQLAVLLFSLPIVTMGAAFTAMHHVLLQVYRNQYPSVWREFFSAFRQNFKQSTIIWLIILAIGVVLYADFLLVTNGLFPWLNPFFSLLLAPGIYLLLSLSWVYVLQSRYHNSIGKTLKNALVMVISHPLYTLINALLMLTPLILLGFSFQSLTVVFFLGFTLPGILRAILYSRIFDMLEESNWREETED